MRLVGSAILTALLLTILPISAQAQSVPPQMKVPSGQSVARVHTFESPLCPQPIVAELTRGAGRPQHMESRRQ